MHQFGVVLHLIGWEDIYKTEKKKYNETNLSLL